MDDAELFAQATIDATDLCVLSKGDAGRPLPMLAIILVQEKCDVVRPCPTLANRCVEQRRWGRKHLMLPDHIFKPRAMRSVHT